MYKDALRYFGWCSQFDALIDNLMRQKQLTLYAHIKRLPKTVISETVNAFLLVLDMEYLADWLVGGYNGGNKQKLSLAIAMIGNSPLVFFDNTTIIFYILFINCNFFRAFYWHESIV